MLVNPGQWMATPCFVAFGLYISLIYMYMPLVVVPPSGQSEHEAKLCNPL